MRCRSSSSPSRRGALGLALALALTGGCFSEIEEGSAQVDVHLVEPGGLGFEMSVAGKERDEFSLLLDAELTNLGTEACHLAISLHTSEPVPEDIPFLTGPPAPAVAGAQVLFETVLAPASEGRDFTRRLAYFELIYDKLEDSDELRRWITVATCEAPDLQIKLSFDLAVVYLARRHGERRAVIQRIWQ